MRPIKHSLQATIEMIIISMIGSIPSLEEILDPIYWIGYFIGAIIVIKNVLAYVLEENDLRK